jgi:hypothetical protein
MEAAMVIDPRFLPEFDPELQSIGHALAVELLAELAPSSWERRVSQPLRCAEIDARDRFGWEFDSAA